jgi:hypothetical protein
MNSMSTLLCFREGLVELRVRDGLARSPIFQATERLAFRRCSGGRLQFGGRYRRHALGEFGKVTKEPSTLQFLRMHTGCATREES